MVKVFCDIFVKQWHRCNVQSSAEITQGTVSLSGFLLANGIYGCRLSGISRNNVRVWVYHCGDWH